jgi:hypothetical protein
MKRMIRSIDGNLHPSSVRASLVCATTGSSLLLWALASIFIRIQ